MPRLTQSDYEYYRDWDAFSKNAMINHDCDAPRWRRWWVSLNDKVLAEARDRDNAMRRGLHEFREMMKDKTFRNSLGVL